MRYCVDLAMSRMLLPATTQIAYPVRGQDDRMQLLDSVPTADVADHD